MTLGGHAHDYPSRDSALAAVATTPGVKELVDEISVDPLSPMDNQIRIAVARAVYGFPSLNKYAIDPAMPIRISVQNGNVELYGVVDSQADKDAAYPSRQRRPRRLQREELPASGRPARRKAAVRRWRRRSLTHPSGLGSAAASGAVTLRGHQPGKSVLTVKRRRRSPPGNSSVQSRRMSFHRSIEVT